MLSAEHTALENAAIRQLLAIREKEIQFFTDRFNAISTQSALIAGFVITSLTAVPLQGANEVLASAFLMSGAITIVCCFYSLLCSTMTGIWGPSLSLRGPNGSVSKAWCKYPSPSTYHTKYLFLTRSIPYITAIRSVPLVVLKQESTQITATYLCSITVFGE